MKTDVIQVNSRGQGFDRALEETARFAAWVGADHKKALQLRLLAEETLGMIRAITGAFEADFWIESTRSGACLLHLDAETIMDLSKKPDLIAISTTKKNAAAEGFMGKVWNLIENSLYQTNEIGRLQADYGGRPVPYGMLGTCDVDAVDAVNPYASLWSLNRYRGSIEEQRPENASMEHAWDELEKSIVASIADDVRVGVRGSRVELEIEKTGFCPAAQR